MIRTTSTYMKPVAYWVWLGFNLIAGTLIGLCAALAFMSGMHGHAALCLAAGAGLALSARLTDPAQFRR